jgi:hypothetical protein
VVPERSRGPAASCWGLRRRTRLLGCGSSTGGASGYRAPAADVIDRSRDRW